MLNILILKEIKALLVSPKFSLTLAACSLLILLSIYTGINEYKASVSAFESAAQIEATNFDEARNLMSAQALVHRKPNPMQIFVSGIHFDIGRLTSISRWSDPSLSRSIYSETPIFALFRMLDLSFIFQMILTLFALLFTYDSICGERESGTLKLAFTNPISRAQFLIAKFIGSSIGLIAPLLIPLLIGLLMLQLAHIPMEKMDWIRVLLFFGSGIVLLLVYLLLGIAVSAWSSRSSTSFLILLAALITSVLIIPRAGVITADSLISVPSDSEISSMKTSYREEKMRDFSKMLSDTFRKRNEITQGMTKEEAKAYRDEKEWEWLEEDDLKRNEMNADVESYGFKLQEDILNKKIAKERLAFQLARISPISSFQLLGMNLAETDSDLKTRYIKSTNDYKTSFVNYLEAKQKESGEPGGFRISISDTDGFKFDMGRGNKIDFSDRPKFEHPKVSIKSILSKSVTDFGLLIAYGIGFFGLAFIGFLRYDMR